jgi:ElaA protein
MSDIEWHFLSFDELSTEQLFELLKARQQVFIIEQECIYPDIDDWDREAWHLMAYKGSELLASLRLLPPGLRYQEASIGRVLTTTAARGMGLGHQLLQQVLPQVRRLFPEAGLRISAQQHLENYYAGYGFETVSAPYDEDGIAHIEMLLPASRE